MYKPKWFPKWTKKSADFKSNGASHKPISSYKQRRYQIISGEILNRRIQNLLLNYYQVKQKP